MKFSFLYFRLFSVAAKKKAYHISHQILSFLIWSGTYRILAKIFKATAVHGYGSDICLKEGFLPVPVHFHSPIPDLCDMRERKIWDAVSDLPGIDFRKEAQIQLITILGSKFGHECLWPLASEDPKTFFLRNPSFSYGCAASTHCMLRFYKPSALVEIGSGMSSRVIASALENNLVDDGKECFYRIIDPYPSPEIARFARCELVENRVEIVSPDMFRHLKRNDILFIDSSHSVKIGSDVNYLFLEILPRLAPGVIIHFHDISLPYEYPRAYATNEAFRQFWTEQYLLEAFLCFNHEFEILLAMQFLMTEHMEQFRQSFPHYNYSQNSAISSSFWIKRN